MTLQELRDRRQAIKTRIEQIAERARELRDVNDPTTGPELLALAKECGELAEELHQQVRGMTN